MNAEMRCPHCNGLLPATSRICVMCGKTQNWAEDIPDEDLEKAQQHLAENPPAPPKLENKIGGSFLSAGAFGIVLIVAGIISAAIIYMGVFVPAIWLFLLPLFGAIALALIIFSWFLWDIWKPSK